MIWPFRKKQPPVPRRKLDVETVRMLLDKRIAENKQSNFKSYWTKSAMALATVKDVEDASAKSYAPWVKDVWECENQAHSLIEAAQRKAANEGCQIAIGIVFADPPGRFQDSERHVYVWIVSGQGIDFYDPTARRWCECPQNIYFSLL
jgi:hypothetical protein